MVMNRNDQVCVISVFGKSNFGYGNWRSIILNNILETSVFHGNENLPKGYQGLNKIGKHITIQFYFNEYEKVLVLNLTSLQDANHFDRSIVNTEGEFPLLLESMSSDYANAVLFLFSLSHLVLIMQPSCWFDTSYVRFFRSLDNARNKLLPFISEELEALGLPPEWVENGRLCSPRVLFIFDSGNVNWASMNWDQLSSDADRKTKRSPLRRMQLSLEDQIYNILRRSRVITNTCQNSLFAIPANQAYVYIHSTQFENRATDLSGFYADALRMNCMKYFQDEQGTQSSYFSQKPSSYGDPQLPVNKISIRDFVMDHVNLALTRGFDDNTGRNPTRAFFMLPTFDDWRRAYTRLYDFFFTDHVTCEDLKEVFSNFHFSINVDLKFSESRCSKILPLAESAYQEGLPDHYTKSIHLAKLDIATSLYLQHARGPALKKYLSVLTKACEDYWSKGRQVCEAISLTGNHCAEPLHRTSDLRDSIEMTADLPVMEHNSKVVLQSVCNCGRTAAERKDPFTVKEANFDFYQRLAVDCCNELECHEFPVFTPSTPDSKPAPHAALAQLIDTAQMSVSTPPQSEIGDDKVKGIAASLSFMTLSLGQSGGSGDFYPHPHEHKIDNKAPLEDRAQSEHALDHQASTTEYLAEMNHSDCPESLLPLFSSWSLVRLGDYNLYNSNEGLKQLPNFLGGTQHLLPYEVTLPNTPKLPEIDSSWPAISEAQTKSKSKKVDSQSTQDQQQYKIPADGIVRCYFGMEYECQQGHRFCCSAPDKMIKVPPHANVRDNASKIMTMDMPLYFQCTCRSARSVARLTRVYAVIPNAPLKVSLKPQVIPDRLPCPIFSPSGQANISLSPGGFWVLRLPYVYVSDREHIFNAATLNECKVLSGMFSVSINRDELSPQK